MVRRVRRTVSLRVSGSAAGRDLGIGRRGENAGRNRVRRVANSQDPGDVVVVAVEHVCKVSVRNVADDELGSRRAPPWSGSSRTLLALFPPAKRRC